jgi:hypothetical protein
MKSVSAERDRLAQKVIELDARARASERLAEVGTLGPAGRGALFESVSRLFAPERDDKLIDFSSVVRLLGISISEAREVLLSYGANHGEPGGPSFSFSKTSTGRELLVNLEALDLLDRYATKRAAASSRKGKPQPARPPRAAAAYINDQESAKRRHLVH